MKNMVMGFFGFRKPTQKLLAREQRSHQAAQFNDQGVAKCALRQAHEERRQHARSLHGSGLQPMQVAGSQSRARGLCTEAASSQVV